MSDQEPTSKRSVWPTWASALGSWLPTVALGALSVQARVSLGHWPVPMRDDFPWIIHRVYEPFLLLSIAVAVGGTVVWPILYLFRALRRPLLVALAQGVCLSLGWASIWVWRHTPAVQILDWLAD